MTVGISISNGLEGVLISDRRVTTTYGSHCDAVIKQVDVNTPHYNGTFCFAGEAALAGIAIQELSKLIETGPSIMSALQSLPTHFTEEMVKKPEESGEEHGHDRGHGHNLQLHKDHEDHSKVKRYELQIMGTGYRDAKLITYFVDYSRLFHGDDHKIVKIVGFTPPLAIGSGAKAVDTFSATNLSGIALKDLKAPDLLMLALQAYCVSTTDSGVGGAPDITLFQESQRIRFDREHAMTAANLAGAYASQGFAELNFARMRNLTDSLVKDVIQPGAFDFAAAANLVDKTLTGLKGRFTPPSSWMEYANQNRWR